VRLWQLGQGAVGDEGVVTDGLRGRAVVLEVTTGPGVHGW
jgi:hypothetical protein